MVAAAVIGAGVIGATGSVIAGGEQAGAAKDAAATQLQMYQQTRADLSPFVQGGTSAFQNLQNFYAPQGQIGTLLGMNPGGSAAQLQALRNTPGYQFAVDQGGQALDRSAASRGLLLSGGQLKDVTSYGQGMADQLFGTTLSQLQSYGTALSGMSSLGENAAAQTGNAGATAANAAGQFQQNAGTANASATAGITNQIGGLLQNSSVQGLFNGSGSGGALTGQAAQDLESGALSDRRVKADIVPIGQRAGRLELYSYRLKGSSRSQIGVMSDEVREVRPDAVRRGSDGLDRVNYRKLGIKSPLERAA